MATYRTITAAADMGAYVSKLVLNLPRDVVDAEDLADAFSVRVDGADIGVLRASLRPCFSWHSDAHFRAEGTRRRSRASCLTNP